MPALPLRFLALLTLLCTCALAPKTANGQTDIPVSFPSDYISDASDIYVDDTGTGFLGGTCGVLRQTFDNGVNWTVVDSPTTDDILSLACPPTSCATALLVTDNALYRLSNSTWADVTYPGFEEGGHLQWLTDNLVVHEAVSSGLWRSANGGADWSFFPYGENKSSELVFVNSTTGFLFGNGKLLKTTDGGIAFTEVGYTHPNSPFHLAWLDETTGWTFDRDRKFWKTTDGGLTWNLLNEEQQLSTLNWFVSLSATHLVAAQGITLAESFDGGVTWARGQFGLDRVTRVGFRYHRSGNAFFLPAAENQVLYSAADFTGWVDLEADRLMRNRLTDLAFSTNETGFGIGGVNLYVTTDAGLNWSANSAGVVLREIGILPSGDPVLLADSRTLVTQDQGQTFTDFFAPGVVPEGEYPDLMAVKPNGDVFFFSNNSSFNSTDGGNTFTRSDHNADFRGTALFFLDDQFGYVVDRNGEFAATTDGGLTWQPRTDVPGFAPESVFFTARDTGWVSSASRRYVTNDGGLNWEQTDQLSGGYDFIRRGEDDAIYAALWDENTLVRSTDEGVSWTALTGNCFGYRTLALTPNERYAFVAGDGFIVRHDLSELVTGTRRASQSPVVALSAYPNPATDLVRVVIPARTTFSVLSVFDLSGRKVEELKVPVGQQTVEVPVAALARGVYVARWVAADGRTGSARLLVQ